MPPPPTPPPRRRRSSTAAVPAQIRRPPVSSTATSRPTHSAPPHLPPPGKLFSREALCRPDLRPHRQVNGAPPPPPATSGPMGGSPSRTSYASATSTPPADAPRPPTSRSEPLLPRAVTAPSDRGQLPPPPATDRRSPLRSLDGLSSPAARTAPVVPRRTAFGDSTLDATPIHGDTEANRIQAGHPPRRSRPSIELL
jgi:hypothetical protein